MARGLPTLSVDHLSKSFGEHHVLTDISFKVYHGEILGLMGGSGSGKSLTLRSIIGLEAPDSGSVRFEGRNLTQLNERELYQVRTQIGYVFQSGALFDSMTVEENLSYPLRKHTRLSDAEIHEQVNDRLKQVDMEGTNNLYPSQISGGMQKRAGLARATMLNQKVVLFDEPTAGLDPINIRRLLRNVRRLRRTVGLSGIFISHDIISLAAVCDRIAILHEGRILSIGTVSEVRASEDPYVREFVELKYGDEDDAGQ